MKQNKKYIYLAVVFLFFVCVLCYFMFFKVPSPYQIYTKSQASIVELKSQTGEDIISCGTAIFIDERGILVTNAHLVVYKESGIYKEFESFQIRFYPTELFTTTR